MIEMRLEGIRLEIPQNTPVLMLREQGGVKRLMPIYIGAPEASSIHYALEGLKPDRPLTHDLLINVVEALDAQPVKLVITNIEENTYFADLHVLQLGKVVKISCRPSDGVAIAVRTSIPIYVEDELLDQVGKVVVEDAPENAEEIIDDFRDFIDSIKPEDFQS
ncbi:MAG: bifunctional nuclease family protein [Actinomycetota bacterium]|jgi:bifunctional DNase/RNase|nr:bifunctional nuclease family protein [Actinomycetota bacterium]